MARRPGCVEEIELAAHKKIFFKTASFPWRDSVSGGRVRCMLEVCGVHRGLVVTGMLTQLKSTLSAAPVTPCLVSSLLLAALILPRLALQSAWGDPVRLTDR